MVIALEVDEGIKEFFKLNMIVEGHRTDVLRKLFSRTKDQVRIVNIKNQPIEIGRLFRNFMKEYGVNKMPNAFQTKCVNFTRTKYFAAGIWRVSVRQGTGQVMRSKLKR